jgi:hypothetical protein
MDSTVTVNFRGLLLRYSEEDQEFLCTLSTYPSLSYLHPDPRIALQGLLDLVLDYETLDLDVEERH